MMNVCRGLALTTVCVARTGTRVDELLEVGQWRV